MAEALAPLMVTQMVELRVLWLAQLTEMHLDYSLVGSKAMQTVWLREQNLVCLSDETMASLREV